MYSLQITAENSCGCRSEAKASTFVFTQIQYVIHYPWTRHSESAALLPCASLYDPNRLHSYVKEISIFEV